MCLRKLNFKDYHRSTKTFIQCVNENAFKGLTSYKITHNPEYALLINAMNEANRNARMGEVGRVNHIDFVSSVHLPEREERKSNF